MQRRRAQHADGCLDGRVGHRHRGLPPRRRHGDDGDRTHEHRGDYDHGDDHGGDDDRPSDHRAPRVSFPDDLSAIAGIADTFTYPGSPIGADVAQCIGDGLVHVFGRAKIAQLGFGIGRWTLLGFSIALGPWNRADSTAVVDTFRVCTPDWELLMVTSATSTAEQLDAGATRCVAKILDDARARDVFITLLDRPDDGTLAPAVADLSQAYAACLTPEQLTSLALGGTPEAVRRP